MNGLPDADAGVVAVVLAAGGGTRYAGPTHKLDTPLAATDTVVLLPAMAGG